MDISGDVNSDGINDIIFSSQWLDVATDYGEVVYGWQSPSAPPQIRRPQWINVGRAGTQLVE
ncbi:MAG: hypothetical protein N2595_00570 [bacterium]|nr:hypothetical protein [bacterium]